MRSALPANKNRDLAPIPNGWQATEEVTFVQLSAEAYQYRDAVRFRNGREVLLHLLRCGQHVVVLSLCSGESREEKHERREEECRRIFVG